MPFGRAVLFAAATVLVLATVLCVAGATGADVDHPSCDDGTCMAGGSIESTSLLWKDDPPPTATLLATALAAVLFAL